MEEKKITLKKIKLFGLPDCLHGGFHIFIELWWKSSEEIVL